MSTKTVKMLTGMITDYYGHLESNGVYELFNEDADPMIANGRCVEVNEKAAISADNLIARGIRGHVRKIQADKIRAKNLIETNLKTDAQKEIAKASLSKYDESVEKLEDKLAEKTGEDLDSVTDTESEGEIVEQKRKPGRPSRRV